MKISVANVVLGVLVVGVVLFVNAKVESLRQETRAALSELTPVPAGGQTQDIVSELQQIQAADRSEAVLAELRQIRELLATQQVFVQPAAAGCAAAQPGVAPTAPQRVTLLGRGAYALGEQDAPVTLVEFVDYQCPFCRRFYDETFDQLKTQYIDTGKLRFISRDLPLPFHAQATQAAQAARCAGEQDQFWALRQILMDNADQLTPEEILGHAQGLTLKMKPFRKCVESDKYLAEIQQDIDDARGVGIGGTPSFVIGTATDTGIAGVTIIGAQPYASFVAQIEPLLPPE